MKTSLLALIPLAFATSSFAVTFPYQNNFDGTGSNTAFTASSGNWTLGSGTYTNTITAPTSTAVTSYASVAVTGQAGTSFTLSTQFTLTSGYTVSGTTQFSTFGFGALGNNANFGGTSTSYYLADFAFAGSTSVGTLRILSQGTTANSDFAGVNATAIASGASANYAIALGTTYTLKLTGTYGVGGALDLALGLYNAAGTASIGSVATASDPTPWTGGNFGFRDRLQNNGGGTFTMDTDNFSLSASAIPEPSSFAALTGVGALLAGVFRRRRVRSA